MTQQRDITSLLDLWLAEGSTVAPDRVIDVVTDRIERQRQRGRWRFPAWEIRMPVLVRLAAVAAALAVVAAGAIYFAGSPRPSAYPPTSGPSPTAIAQTLSYTAFRPGVFIDLPPGWTHSGDAQQLTLTYGAGSQPAGTVVLVPNPVVASSAGPCQDNNPGAVGTSVAAITQKLEQDRRISVVHGADITVNGYPTQLLDIELRDADLPGACSADGNERSALLFGEPGSLIRLFENERVRVILVEAFTGGDTYQVPSVIVPMLIYVRPNAEARNEFFARAAQLYHDIYFLP